MNKETKQLNIFLLSIVAIAFLAAVMTPTYESQIKAVELKVDNMEVSQEVYRAIYAASLTCELKGVLEVALADNKISYIEAEEIAAFCVAEARKHADQPFQRGQLEQELNYTIHGGVSM